MLDVTRLDVECQWKARNKVRAALDQDSPSCIESGRGRLVLLWGLASIVEARSNSHWSGRSF